MAYLLVVCRDACACKKNTSNIVTPQRVPNKLGGLVFANTTQPGRRTYGKAQHVAADATHHGRS